MNRTRKILRNTAALYIKIILSTVVSLFVTRIALNKLGVSDFGLYSLVAGVIAVFAFLSGALMISTQRYLSIAIGEKDSSKLDKIFASSKKIHLIATILLFLILISIQYLAINFVLNIDEASLHVAHFIYDTMVLSACVTIATVPYVAAINAHEDLHIFAITEILGLIIKLVAAAALWYLDSYLLLIYTFAMFIATCIPCLARCTWCRIRYEECIAGISKAENTIIKSMIGFVSWNTLGTFAVIGRTQGIAVILNIIYGVTINSAYAIANSIYSLVLSFASNLTAVVTPVITESKGAGDVNRTEQLALLSSKLCFLLSSSFSLVLLLLLGDILFIWLTDVPKYTEEFAFYMLISFVIMQIYPGLNRLIYAYGDIKGYQISISITILGVIPVGWLALHVSDDPTLMLKVMCATQLANLAQTIYYAYKIAKINLTMWINNFAARAIMIFFLSLLCGGTVINYLENDELLTRILISTVFLIIYTLISYMALISPNEKALIVHVLKRK